MLKRRIIVCLISVALLISFGITVFAYNTNRKASGFFDVPDGYWAKEQIEYFASRGILNGYEDGSFKPDNGVTREEFCKLLVNAFSQPVEEPQTRTFSDVDTNRWSYPYIEMCRSFLTGYINPFGGLPAFHPEEYATREDITVALVKMMGYDEKSIGNKKTAAAKFRDGDTISPNLLAYVSLACEKGIINGYPDGTFRASDGISRAEVVVLLNRVTKQAVTDIDGKMTKPELQINKYPEISEVGTIKITGYVHDENDKNPSVTVDGKKAQKNGDAWSFEKELDIGENRITIVATNKNGAKTEEIITICYASKPEIVLDMKNGTITTYDDEIVIKGSVTDECDYEPRVTVNGKSVRVKDGKWSFEAELNYGTNEIEIVAVNKYGLSTSVTGYVVCKERDDEDDRYDKDDKDDKYDDNKAPAAVRGFSVVTRIAVAKDSAGEVITKISIAEGEQEGVVWIDERSRNRGNDDKIGVGDVFMYAADSSGYVSEYLIIARLTQNNDFEFTKSEYELERSLSSSRTEVDLVAGYIENTKRRTKGNGEIITVNGQNYLIASSAYKYTLDVSGRNDNLEISDFMYKGDYFVPNSDEDGEPTGTGFACPVLLRIVEGEVIDVYTTNARIEIPVR